MPAKSQAWGAPMGPSNQMVRRISRSWPWIGPGFRMGGSISIMGIKAMMLKMPTTAKSSETRDRGRRQWDFVKRKATAATGAPLVMTKMKEKVAM